MSAPSVILFVTDQHRADYLGCYGHPRLRTPHIDGLAATGTRFSRFYVSMPICMPNRATMMTGRMPSVHGVRHNGIGLSLQANSFVDLLRAAGYRTALIGKSHLQTFTETKPQRLPDYGNAPAPPEELRDALKPSARGGPYDQERSVNWLRGEHFPLTMPYYGFDHVRLCTEHGDEVGGHYYYWLRQRCKDTTALRGRDNALPSNVVAPQAWRTAVPEELYPTTFVADEAIAYLRAAASADAGRPFFMQVSFPDPHHPFTPPGRYFDMYRPEDMALPESFRRADPEMQPHVAFLQSQLTGGKASRESPAAYAVNEREARETMALTCGQITMIDDAIGRVLAELKRLGRDQDTVIAFTTDHGDFLGDHQLMLKGPMHFQGLIRVPFIWNDPAAPRNRATSSALSGTIDIARTILARAGVTPYNGMQGRSLLPWTDEPKRPGPDAILIEEEGQRTAYGFGGPVRCRTLVTQRWRMTKFHATPWGELYDLENDPHEMNNLWWEPSAAATRAELAMALIDAELNVADRSPLPTAMA